MNFSDGEQNISHLQNLKILSIQSNRLTMISGLADLPNLEEIYMSHNALTEISGLDGNHNLRVLDVSNNQIQRLSGFKQLSRLEELWASSNLLGSFEEIERELKDKQDLNTVYFEANPLQLKNPALYRNKVRLALPQIEKIDASKCFLRVVLIRTIAALTDNQRMFDDVKACKDQTSERLLYQPHLAKRNVHIGRIISIQKSSFLLDQILDPRSLHSFLLFLSYYAHPWRPHRRAISDGRYDQHSPVPDSVDVIGSRWGKF